MINNIPKIFEWLSSQDWKYESTKWKVDADNPVRFSNNLLEALYVYPDKMKYWEDIRVNHIFVEFRSIKEMMGHFKNKLK